MLKSDLICRLLPISWVLLVLAGLAGCSNGPKLYPVYGKVVYPDGSPMQGGAVMFEAVDNPRKVMAQGTIDNETGAFALTTYKDGDGAMEGRYRVIIRGRRSNPKREVVDPVTIGQIHPRFQDFQTSGLEFTVEPKSNEFVIRVERAPKVRG
jgi:hypothetical protein